MSKKGLFSCDISGLKAKVAQVKAFFDPTVAKPSPLGKAVAAAARDVYLELQRNAPVNTDGSAKDPGLLKRSVYRYFDESRSPSANHITYQVGVNLRKAPHFHLADQGHNFYENYAPFRMPYEHYRPAKDGYPKWFGSPFISRRKLRKNAAKGPVVFRAKGHRYLEQTFNPTVISRAVKQIETVYLEQFNEAMKAG